MPRRMVVLGVLVCLVVPATGYAEKKAAKSPAKKEVKSSAKLWDVGAKNSFTKRFKNRNLWKQVPYGTTDYKFENDVVLENDFFCIYFSRRSACDFHGKVDGQPKIWRNCLYRVYQDPKKYRLEERPGQSPRSFGRRYGYHGIKSMKIIKNTPEEVVVEHEGIKYPIPATLRILKDKPWVEVTPLHHKEHTEQGIHGKVRIAIAPNEKGNDYVVDCLRDPGSRPKAPPCRMLLCFYESGSIPFMWVISWSSPFAEAAPYVINDSGPKGDRMWWGGVPGAPRASQGCITSSWARYGKKGSVVVGGLTYWNNWHRDVISKPIKKGEVYTSKWKPPYPGKWRMTVRIAQKKYDQGFKYDGKTKFPARYFSKDVIVGKSTRKKKSTKGGKLTFRSPIDGWLDYSIIYMYDRTKETPKNILTPMDQYRWTIRQGKKKDKKTGQAPKALGGVLAGVCATGIKTTIDDVKSGKRADAVKKGFRVIKTSGSCSRITLSFNRDLNLKEAKRAENYQITPADVEQLQVVAVGKFVMLSGLKLKKSKKYIINISDAVKDTDGKAIAKVNRAVEYTPVYDKRKIRVSTVQPLKISEWEKHYSTGDKGEAGYLKYIMGLVEEAGRIGSDIVCLPEAIPISSKPRRSRYIPGPFFNTLAEKAKKHSMYIVAHMLEKEEKLLKAKGPKARRSTAFIIDRKGELLGKFRKVHLTEGESRHVVPGNTFPVFQTDFGKIGALICFDVIAFSESMRLLALNGAEIVFFPHATGRGCENDIILRSRAVAMENGLYVVPSHYGRIISDDHGSFGRSSVIGPDGFIRADAGTDPGVASAVIDLEKKRLGYGWGTGGVNDIRQRIFKHRRPAIYGGLSEKKKSSSSSGKRGK